MRSSMRTMCWYSVFSVRKNLRRAGTLKNRSRTSTRVPKPCEAGAGALISPSRALTTQACAAVAVRDANDRRETEAILGSASPRNPKVAHVLKILQGGNLARGMPRQRQSQVGRIDADAIVRDADQPAAAALEFNLDAPRARIQRVFDQLLDHGSRALDHLAGGDLVDQGIGQ